MSNIDHQKVASRDSFASESKRSAAIFSASASVATRSVGLCFLSVAGRGNAVRFKEKKRTDGGRGMSGREQRERGCVHDSQAVHSNHSGTGIHHRVGITSLAHRACL